MKLSAKQKKLGSKQQDFLQPDWIPSTGKRTYPAKMLEYRRASESSNFQHLKMIEKSKKEPKSIKTEENMVENRIKEIHQTKKILKPKLPSNFPTSSSKLVVREITHRKQQTSKSQKRVSANRLAKPKYKDLHDLQHKPLSLDPTSLHKKWLLTLGEVTTPQKKKPVLSREADELIWKPFSPSHINSKSLYSIPLLKRLSVAQMDGQQSSKPKPLPLSQQQKPQRLWLASYGSSALQRSKSLSSLLSPSDATAVISGYNRVVGTPKINATRLTRSPSASVVLGLHECTRVLDNPSEAKKPPRRKCEKKTHRKKSKDCCKDSNQSVKIKTSLQRCSTNKLQQISGNGKVNSQLKCSIVAGDHLVAARHSSEHGPNSPPRKGVVSRIAGWPATDDDQPPSEDRVSGLQMSGSILGSGENRKKVKVLTKYTDFSEGSEDMSRQKERRDVWNGDDSQADYRGGFDSTPPGAVLSHAQGGGAFDADEFYKITPEEEEKMKFLGAHNSLPRMQADNRLPAEVIRLPFTGCQEVWK
jgi:hypothetical protein